MWPLSTGMMREQTSRYPSTSGDQRKVHFIKSVRNEHQIMKQCKKLTMSRPHASPHPNILITDNVSQTMNDGQHTLCTHNKTITKNLPSNSNLSSLRASRLSLRSCRSISWLIRFCSFASSDIQHVMFQWC